jgi:hypothetical protein
MQTGRTAIVALASATAVGSAVYALVVRPRSSRWGATDQQVRRSLPGDELLHHYMESGMLLDQGTRRGTGPKHWMSQAPAR